MLKRFTIALSALSLALLASCEPAAPLVPFEIVLVTGAPTTQAIATSIVAAPTFEVRTESGKAIKNVDVTVTTGANSGSLVGAPLKTGAGATSIGNWTLGTAPGTQTVTVAAEGLTPLVISVTAVPGAASALTLLVGNGQLAGANTSVAGPINIQVTDAFSNPIAGVTVNWSVTAGGGNVAAPTSVTAGNGVATSPTWTLGAGGTQTLQASVGAVTQNVNAIVQTPPASIQISQAAPGTSLLGATLNPPPSFVVRDSSGNALPGVPLTVVVTAGGGSLNGAPTVSAAAGAPTSIGTWTLGNNLGTQSVTVSVVGVTPLVISTTAATLYDLQVVYTAGAPAPEVATAFTNAVTRIKGVVVGQMSTVGFTNFDAGPCVAGLVINENVGGLRIYATIEAIDGAGGILGSAGPCYTRTSNNLPVVGRMRFDSADIANMVANGSLESVILHEMLHVVGMTGPMWDLLGVKIGLAPGSVPQFTGTQARQACINDNLGANTCASFVPIEDCKQLDGITTRAGCGAGTINSHWHELRFGNELMTGFASAGLNPFSKMTIMALADMGYSVNALAFDAYTAPLGFMSPIPAATRQLPEPTAPIAQINAQGQVTRIFRDQ